MVLNGINIKHLLLAVTHGKENTCPLVMPWVNDKFLHATAWRGQSERVLSVIEYKVR